MKVKVFKNPDELGKAAAKFSAEIINKAIAEYGKARIILSTGASQFDTLKHLVKEDVDWSKVEMFHLDEYINLPETHPASFRKYLKERFVSIVNPGKVFFVDGEGDVEHIIRKLNEEVAREPIHLGLIGIGENAHIAFNDPPADFDTTEPYIIVNLNDDCKKQQVGEGWFATVDDVPKQAISMSVHQILQCNVILSCVPYKVKAKAIKMTLESDVTNMIPATKLKEHKNVYVYVDEDSASAVDKDVLAKYL
ncbi:MAG: glucosamine-6-phosphate deaminase [Clostridiaceae bacterium]|jgi:glucosamine-6-phosphate deaminase|nr:glucosamine-6-phosphate deaminase [Clostridiaceae bacterium]